MRSTFGPPALKESSSITDPLHERRFRARVRRVVLASLTAAGCTSETLVRDASIDVETDVEVDAACNGVPLDASSLDDSDCAAFYALPCGLPASAVVADCYPDLGTCASVCDTHLVYYCVLAPSVCTVDAGLEADADMVVECVTCTGGGRKPRGLRLVERRGRVPLGEYFRSMARLEAASVQAFEDLVSSLLAFGAPRSLVAAACRARDDERRHTVAMARLGLRFHALWPEAADVTAKPPSSLATLLEDDAIEGCVHETYGALLATWQSKRSRDRVVRQTMRRIAIDETRHAALAWAIIRWGLPQLGLAERRHVLAALQRAASRLETKDPPAVVPREMAGLPSASEARLLARGLRKLAREELTSNG
jgi:hypothetical protein